MLRDRFGEGILIVNSPLIVPKFLSPEYPSLAYRAVIFTSETAVEAFQRLSADPRLAMISEAWCVGDRTAMAARNAGLLSYSAGGDVAALQALLLAAQPQGPYLYFHGRDQRGDLALSLSTAGLETVSAVAYAQEPQPLNATATKLLSSHSTVILPIFSPRTASLFLAEYERLNSKAQLLMVAISDAVAQVVQTVPNSKLVVAGRPNAEAMLDAVGELIAAVPDA